MPGNGGTVISSGYGNGTITAIYAENTTHQVRTASIPSLSHCWSAGTNSHNKLSLNQHWCRRARASEFRIYPNPTKGAFRIACADNEKNPVEVNILDLTGKMMLKNTQHARERNTISTFRLLRRVAILLSLKPIKI